MKKELHFYLFIFILLLSGCKKEQEDSITPDTPEELIKGVWLNNSYHYILYRNGVKFEEDTDTGEGKVEFKNNRMYSTGPDGEHDEGTYTLKTDAGKTIITITANSQTEEVEITKLTKTEMVWLIKGSEIDNGAIISSEEYHGFIKQ